MTRGPRPETTPAARPVRRLLASGALLALAACGDGNGASPASYVEQAVALAPDIERATGLRFTAPPKVEVRTREQVRAFLQRELDEPDARAELEGVAGAWRALGMIPDTLDLRALMIRVLQEQVIGYYDPPTKTLYLVQGADSGAAAVTLRHELVHALQDQHLDLDSLLSLRGQADRATAAHAALEGQATWVQLGGARDLAMRTPGGWDRTRETIRANMDQTPVLASAPFIVRETLLFPYLSGAELARRIEGTGHPDSLLKRLPASTEQVLHGDRFAAPASAPGVPVAVTLPAPRAGTVRAENTLGEFETRLVLFQHLQDLGIAAGAAGGWGGDRWQLVRTAAGDAFVWVTVWDADQDAAEFFDAMTQVVPRRHPSAALGPSREATTRSYTVPGAPGGARALQLRAATIGGRPAVLYVDAPAAAGADLVDLARVTLAP